MLYSAQQLYRPLPFHVCSSGRFNNIRDMISMGVNPAYTSAAWPANNRAIYAPVNLPQRFTVARFMVANGSNATGNVDVGLYDSNFNRLMSTGTIARSGTSVVQYFDVADQPFPPGHYYLALVGSSTTGSYGSGVASGLQLQCQMSGWLQEALGSTVLPATMTPVAYSAVVNFAFGFTQSDTL